MSNRKSAGKVRKTYQFIESNRHQFPVQVMCQVLGVAPSGYYEWLKHPISKRAEEDARLLKLIRASFIASHGVYGAPRVFLDLREAGETCKQASRRAANAGEWLTRPAGLSNTPRIGQQTRCTHHEPAQTAIYRHQAQSSLGYRHYLRPHVARLAVLGRSDGFCTPERSSAGRREQPSIRSSCSMPYSWLCDADDLVMR